MRIVMEPVSGQFLTLLGIVGGLGVLGILHVMATAIRNESEMHNLTLRVHELRREQMEKLKRLAEMGSMTPARGGKSGHKKAA